MTRRAILHLKTAFGLLSVATLATLQMENVISMATAVTFWLGWLLGAGFVSIWPSASGEKAGE